MVDAIGSIDSIKKCVTATATKKGNVAFTLKDLRDNVLDCTLWDGLSVQFLDFYNNRANNGPVVMIIKHARVKEPQGVYPLQFTNVWNGTKLLFDTKIPEINVFLN
ncbi:replication protein A 70 kDa DNA-binding subunit C-like, partial [Trifolium medium]|nr:replication protein A 70 kDa DNA-binding subunit C-like [Trifolium medium]